MYISRHVKFDELTFPFKSQFISAQSEQALVSNHNSTWLSLLPVRASGLAPVGDNPVLPATSPSAPTPAADPIQPPLLIQTDPPPISTSHQVSGPSTAAPDPPDPLFQSGPSPLASDPATNLNSNFPTSTLPISTVPEAPLVTTPAPSRFPTHSMTTRTRDNTCKARIFSDHVALTSSILTEPKTYNQAKNHKEWVDAMTTEHDALLSNHTWTLVPPSPEQNVVGCKWVYKIKRCADGSLEHYKTRLVAKGFHQEEGVDFFETFSHVVRPTTIRVALMIALTYKWHLRQLDVQNAFLHGDLQETVFMQQPPRFVYPSKPNYVCRLSKAIYGLK